MDSAVPTPTCGTLSRQVRASAELTAAFDGPLAGFGSASGRPGRIGGDAFRAGFATFLRDQGSRGPNEWEHRARTPGRPSPPSPLAADRPHAAGRRRRPRPRRAAPPTRRRREAATARVEAALAGDPAALAQFRAGLHSARLYLAGRERTKTTCIRIIHEVRMAVRELGRATATRRRPPACCWPTSSTPSSTSPTSSRPAWRRGSSSYLTLFELDPPFIIQGRSRRSTSGPAARPRPPPVPPLSLSARSSPGCRAALARPPAGPASCCDPSDPAGLEPGDVLVAPITDPSWTPLFVPAAAVVVEVGAQVSHAVIVSRELGIPCVVSVHGATTDHPGRRRRHRRRLVRHRHRHRAPGGLSTPWPTPGSPTPAPAPASRCTPEPTPATCCPGL